MVLQTRPRQGWREQESQVKGWKVIVQAGYNAHTHTHIHRTQCSIWPPVIGEWKLKALWFTVQTVCCLVHGQCTGYFRQTASDYTRNANTAQTARTEWRHARKFTSRDIAGQYYQPAVYRWAVVGGWEFRPHTHKRRPTDRQTDIQRERERERHADGRTDGRTDTMTSFERSRPRTSEQN